MKKTKVLFFSLVLVLFALFFSGVNFKAAEVATSDTISVKGAQVRTSDPLGIRFVGTAEGEYDAYGIAIAFGDVDVNQVVLGATVNGKAVLSAEASEKDGDGQFYISLISIPAEMYGQKVTARAYVKNGEDVTYAKTATTRSYYGTAKLAYEAGDRSDKVAEVYNNLPKTSFDYNGGEYKAEFELNVNCYNSAGSTFGNYATLATPSVTAAGTTSNFNWYRVYMVADPNYDNIYKVVGVASEGEKEADAISDIQYEYVLAAHGNCLDKTALNNIKKIVASKNATNYFLSLVMPTSASSNCNVSILADTNYNYLCNVPSYFDLNDALPTLKKQNYDFIGWCTDDILTSDVTLVNDGESKYYAKFKPTTYFISYELGDGNTSVELVNSYNVEDSEIILPADNTMSIENGYFLGWYDNEAYTGEPITTFDTTKGGNVTLYAKWYVNKTTVVELSAADMAAVTALVPTKVVSPAFSTGVYVVNGVEYTMNTNAFSSVASALTTLQAEEKIYVFAGTYSETLTINKNNVTLYGPNYNVKGTAVRSLEAEFTANIIISSNYVTINGIKTSGTVSKIDLKDGYNNMTIVNNYLSGRDGHQIIMMCSGSGTVSNVVIDNNAFVTSRYSYGYRPVRVSGTCTNFTFTNNYFSNNVGSQRTLTDYLYLNKLGGAIIISNNNFDDCPSSNYMFDIQNASAATSIEINNNIFSGSNDAAAYASGIRIKSISGNVVCSIKGNTFDTINGTLIATTGNGIVNIEDNTFNLPDSVTVKLNVVGNTEKSTFKNNTSNAAILIAGGIVFTTEGNTFPA